MNDDLLTPKPHAPSTPIAGDAPPDDTEEQDTVTDRVFDFSDGDIKPVQDTDGPVTHSVNLKIAEALRNPSATLHTDTPVSPTPPITPASTSAWKPLSTQIPIPTKIPAETPQQKPIIHPKIEPGMQAPAVRVYSQVSHTSIPVPSIQSTQPTSSNLNMSPSSFTASPAAFAIPKKPAPVTPDVSLQDVLKRAYTKSQNHPALSAEVTLDKKIGTFESTPFAPATKTPTVLADTTSIEQPYTDTSSASAANSMTSSIKPIPMKIPLEQPITVAQTRTTPSNPQPKTVGTRMSDFTDASFVSRVSTTPHSLQDAISAVLPSDSKTVSSTSQTSILPTNTRATGNTGVSGPASASSFLKPIRTYEGDVAEVMSHRRTSTASIALAETRRSGGEERIGNQSSVQEAPKSHAFTKIAMISLSLILIGGGIFGGYYFYMKSPLAPTAQQPVPPSQPTGLVPADSRVTIALDGLSPIATLARIRTEGAKEQKNETIREFIFTKKDTAGTLVRVNGPDMLTLLDIDMPDIIVRTLNPEWMLGVYTDQTGNSSAFAVVTTNFFQNAFAGMLQWEQVMHDDLKKFLRQSPIASYATSPLVAQNATTSTTTIAGSLSTSTQKSPVFMDQFVSVRGIFQDRIIKNKDVRSYRTENGQTLFLYSFIDNTRLIVAENESVLSEILTRLEKKSFIR